MAVNLQLPHGFRFHPTDEELVLHYLCRKCASLPISASIIAELDLYKFNPWDLPDKASYGEKEWYFFTPRDRKYPNGTRPNRAAGCGYWKATGADKAIGNPRPVAIKKALVFYIGKAPKGEKTNWIMHEYRLADVDRSVYNSKNSTRLDDWVLCRIYNKNGYIEKPQDNNAPEPLASLSTLTQHVHNGQWNFNPSDYVPQMHTNSSGSEHVMSSQLTCEVQREDKINSWVPQMHTNSSGSEHVMSSQLTYEVQSEDKINSWDQNVTNLSNDNFNDPGKAPMDYNNLFSGQFQGNYQLALQKNKFTFPKKHF